MRHLVLASILALGSPSLALADSADPLTVPIDQARILRIPRQAGSVIIGNPSIADITIHDARTLVLTGRSYGLTNLVVLDTNGDVVLDDSVMVSTVEDHSLRVYRQGSRQTFACAPTCEPKVTIGDDPITFESTTLQVQRHDALSQSSN
ncbi:pilus assembly protein N-terminal domain-containing protein [Aureimonas phyllosphaerae]|uniref:Flp pilus assembly secretin CpaC n=1 Tax=Aureimonas phyllosphaerae TaxID=1166078 RepID=A0A7W6FTG1_9HYPH|nr:pilus assembly protein N-terminal domain-containing protein [Aureimonas phyllosphaerae]MBB3933977.1 Flp pilus assembly secretin CpaC [Aureimonas phyllosphaerae]MBB3958807.1 Flp pilus assembly secretin CpaC [Aureimonas phyllosphaerae]SFF19661.1 Pilus formation protein N terminal region [Aureimonas phyllosphaerae]